MRTGRGHRQEQRTCSAPPAERCKHAHSCDRTWGFSLSHTFTPPDEDQGSRSLMRGVCPPSKPSSP
eukprot:765134-Hanusia_phi.AAC.4